MATGTQSVTDRLSDLQVTSRGQENTLNLPNNAVQIVGAAGATFVAPLTVVFDTQNVLALGRVKSVIIVVTTAILHAAGQATIRPYGGLQFFAGGSGAASQLPANGNNNDQALLGSAATNLGAAAATSLPIGMYIFTPTEIPQLQWEIPWIGLEFNWSAAVTAGAFEVFMVMGPN